MNTTRHAEADVVCGKWRLEREIGRGAYGVVYLSVNGKGERAAVKVCRRGDTGDERYERELRGARLYSAIPPQEGLVRMREFAEAPWGFYYVMELADDEFDRESPEAEAYRPKTLTSVIESEKALPLTECVKLGVALAKGLETLQRRHLMHRDIKPGNVLYVDGRPVLSDPGLVVEEAEAASLVGTPGYVPPENFIASAGDIYSLGLTLKAASFGRRVEDLDKGPALEADTGAKSFPAWWRILNKATDPAPSLRYQSAKALLKDLKGLRLKMAVAKFSLLYKVAIGVALWVAIAYVYASYRERKSLEPEIKRVKQFFAIQQAIRDASSQDEVVWSSFVGSYFCRTDESHRQRLKRVEEKDPLSAAEMRDILKQMVEIDKKGVENNKRIMSLREKANSGQDVAESYNQAELLSMENGKLVKAWLSLLERFTLMEDAVKARQ
ncbi:MAG: serine/threonine protein kinase [Kiritimatiellae bacterium]|nr:serine/threonine protein kinase [Kiritimatiellia bacterium]